MFLYRSTTSQSYGFSTAKSCPLAINLTNYHWYFIVKFIDMDIFPNAKCTSTRQSILVWFSGE